MRLKLGFLLAALAAFLVLSRVLGSLVLDYHWWSEMGQVDAWLKRWFYQWVPGIVQWLILAIILWVAHARGMKYAGTGLGEHPGYARVATIAAFVLALLLTGSGVDGWTAARFVAGRGVEAAWQDPVFGRSLAFYFFELPFWSSLLRFVTVAAAAGAVVYYLSARLWQLRLRFPHVLAQGQLDWRDIRRLGELEGGFFRGLVAMFLVALAASFWLGRYSMLYTDHGELMVGIDYVQQNAGLPLQYAKVGAALIAAVLILIGRRKWALACAAVLLADILVPPILSSVYVRPNELALERSYIERHIEATRTAYGLDQRTREVEFAARKQSPIDFAANAPLLDNVRLWEWRAFHDTLSQTQPLRPYGYADADLDRYTIDGQLRQVLLAPRELDLGQLGAATSRWVISHTIYTHGYGLVLAEANRITASGQPELIIRNAPVEVLTPSLKVTRPEIYYGEQSNDPVFVRTTQPEFNYPSGSDDVNTTYEGRGGFPISSSLLRTLAAWTLGDWNIVLSDALTSESRMMIRRSVTTRLAELAPFLSWDADPYLVITEDGRLVWMVDGFTTSDRHPLSRASVEAGRRFNYIRNSVKATVDAYHGEVRLYVFDEADPLIQAYSRLFPSLFTPASEMPTDLRAHARAPELLFKIQAEIYRAYHMRNPESFYNRADYWDLAVFTGGRADIQGRPVFQPMEPTYLMATLPGETQQELLLTIPFTPRGKQNLIGLMVARCDGEHLGEIVFLQLPKQEIIPGPLQIEAMITQDQVISKDLTLWNQQGSQVLRGQIQVLPISNTFLFVAPLYIQAAQARMPQLEKVVIAAGDNLVYANTYPEALAELRRLQSGARPEPSREDAPPVSESRPAASGADPRIGTIRSHLERYRRLVSEGRLAEAGKELEAVQALVELR